MLTLRTLKELIDTPKRGEKLPTPKQLRTGESPVVAHKTTGAGVNEVHIIVYQSGYAVYGIGNRATVFPVNLELGYGYSSVTEKKRKEDEKYNTWNPETGLREKKYFCELEESFFEKEEWYLRLMLIGEDRLAHNLATRDRGRCISFNGMLDIMTPFAYKATHEIEMEIPETDRWTGDRIKTILLNQSYIGSTVYGNGDNGVMNNGSRIRVGGSETRRTKKHQQFITENHHKGIVTHEEFELAQLVIGNQKQKGFARDAGFSLKGKVKCGNCGLKMMYNYGAMPVVYCGHTAAVGSMSTCDKTRYSAAKIERIVLVVLRKQLEIFQSMAKILEEGEEKNKTNLPAMQRNMEQELEKLKAERIRQYEAYAEGVVNQETYLKNKKDLNEKIEIIQDKYEQIQEVTSVEDDLMKDIRTVEKNAEEVNILKKMTRHIAEIFVEEITIYDSEKIEIRFVFDDLLIGMADRIKKKTEDIA